jgi:serine/threonine protein kinase
MRGGEMLERLSEKDYLSEHEIIRYVKQILEGVKDMHEKDVLHLDLKVGNACCYLLKTGSKCFKYFSCCSESLKPWQLK